MAQQSLISLVIRATAQTPGVNQALGSVAGGVVNLSGKTQRLNAQFQKTGFFLTAMLQRAGQFAKRSGQVLIGAFGDMLKVAGQFDKQVVRIGALLQASTTTVRDTSKEVQILRDVFLDVAAEMPTTATELSKVGAELAQLGLLKVSDNTTEFRINVEALTRSAVQLGTVAKGLPIDKAAQDIGALARLFGIADKTGEDFRRQLDVLVSQLAVVQSRSGGTADEIFRVVQRFAVMGRAAGLSSAQILSLAAATQDVRVRAATAGTNLSKFIAQLAVNLRPIAGKLGLSPKDLEELESGSEDAFTAIAAALNTLRERTSARNLKGIAGLTQLLSEMGLSSQRAKVVVNALGVGFDRLTGNISKLNQVQKDSFAGISAVSQMFEQSRNNIADAAREFEGAVETFKISLIAPAAGILITVFGVLRDAVQLLSNIIPAPIRAMIGGFILISGVILLAVGALLLLASFIGTIRLLTASLAKEAGIAFGFKDFLKLPFVAISGFFALIKRELFKTRLLTKLTAEELKKLPVDVRENLKDQLIPVKSATTPSGGKAFRPLVNIPGRGRALLGAERGEGGLVETKGLLGRGITRLKKSFVDLKKIGIKEEIGGIRKSLGKLESPITTMGFLFRATFRGAGNAVKLLGKSILFLIKPLNLLKLALLGIKLVARGGIFTVLILAAILLAAVWKVAGKQILGILRPLIEAFKTIGEELGPVFADLFKTLGVLLVAIVAPLAGLALAVLTAVVPALVQLVNVFVPIIKVVTQIISIFLKILVPVLLVVSAVITAMLAGPLAAFIAIMGIFQPVLEGAAWLLNQIADGIKWIADQINSLAAGILNLLKSVPIIGDLLGGGEVKVTGNVDVTNKQDNKPTLAEGASVAGRTVLQTSSATPFQSGGIITNGPILGLVGEAGPEAVIPLDSTGFGGPINITIPVTLDGIEIGRETVEISEEELRRHGRAPLSRFGGSA